MKTQNALRIVFTGLLGLSSLTAFSQSSSVWARIYNDVDIPQESQTGGIEANNTSFAQALTQVGVVHVRQTLSNSKNEALQNVYAFDCQCDEAALTQTLRSFPGIIAEIERAPEYHTLYVPNDYQAAFGNNYALDLIKAQQAWDLSHSNASFVIGISDENLNVNHEEIAGKVTYYNAIVTGKQIGRAHV